MSGNQSTTGTHVGYYRRRSPLVRFFTGQSRKDFERLMANCDLPDPLRGLVRTVVKRCRLWPRERHEVALELIAHFQDGLDAGRSEDELIKSFGDPEQAARLIRRAKKRNRPLWWRAMRRTRQTIGVLILALIFLHVALIIRFYAASPSPEIDYLARINAPIAAVPEEERAWPRYREALLMLGVTPDANVRELLAPADARPGDDEWDESRTFLIEHQAALELLRRAAEQPALGLEVGAGYAPDDQVLWGSDEELHVPILPPVFHTLLPHLVNLRGAGRLLYADAYRAAEDGQSERVAENVRAALRIGEHAAEHPFIVNDLVSVAIFQGALDVVGDVLHDHASILSDDDLRIIAHSIAAWRGGKVQVRVDGERMVFEDVVQHIYSDDGHGGGRLTPEGLRVLQHLDLSMSATTDAPPLSEVVMDALLGPLAGVTMADRRSLMRTYDEIMGAIERDASRPMWEWQNEADRKIHRLVAEGFLTKVRYAPIWMLTPALTNAAMSANRTVQSRDAILTAIALELHRRRHGEWPDSLEQLVPHLLPAVPPDQFDGRPIRYRVIDGKPRLYSVGANREDHGGIAVLDERGQTIRQLFRWVPTDRVHEVPNGDWVLWPRPTR